MKSPFKFLDAYDAEDSSVFFGRNEAITQLYELSFKSSLILVYGLSGTGKTSIVKCGLAAKFDGPDWFPLFIRRGNNLNQSMVKALQDIFPKDEQWDQQQLNNNIHQIFEEYLRPIYLIFDQFEELFILGSSEEQAQFAQNIASLINSTLPCKVILILREEYLGQLYFLEKALPSIFDFRQRIEPMGRKNVQEVLIGSFNSFNVQLEEPQMITEQIYEHLSTGKSGIQLPYLQVYMDSLYKKAFKKAQPKQLEVPSILPELKIGKQDILDLGPMKDVLSQFMEEQQTAIQEKINQEYPGIESSILPAFMDVLVSEEGTKRPLYFQKKEGHFQLEQRIHEFLPKVPASALDFIILQLEQARILRISDQQLELSHDTLALLIDQERGEYQRMVNLYFSRIINTYRAFDQTKEYLSIKALNAMSPYFKDLKGRLDPHLLKFYQESQAHAKAAAANELAKEKRKRRNATIVAVLGVALSLLAGVGFFMAKQNAESARKQAFQAYLRSGEALKVEWEFTAALQQLEAAKDIAHLAVEKDTLQILQTNWSQIQGLVSESEVLFQSSNYLDALQKIQLALTIDADQSLIFQDSIIQEKIRDEVDLFLQAGRQNERDGDTITALSKYQRVIELDPQNVEALNRISALELKE